MKIIFVIFTMYYVNEVLMKKLLILGIVLLSLNSCAIAGTNLLYPYNFVNVSQNNLYDTQNKIYNNDLTRIEQYLFDKTYKSETAQARINRIERQLFNRCYPTMNISQRMNNILANYHSDYNGNYLSDYYNSTSRTPAQRIMNRFIGQPTGYTPPITNSYFDSGNFGAVMNRAHYSNRGYRYRNTLPAGMGAGLRIID